ncbi:MAG TPA: hypothetical protein VGN72_12320 [Tepidisphaeraceae bacterium]|nr:hypothetical protein [Tepidisphaeraceae bacterium]
MPVDAPALVAAFDHPSQAHAAIVELERAGFSHDDVGYMTQDAKPMVGGTIVDAPAADARGALSGAITGGMVGGVLAAAVSILVPGVGPVLAGGVLAAFFGGTLAGTAVGGILGALQGLGLSEEHAAVYERHFQQGRAVIVVKPGDRTGDAEQVLRRHGALDLHTEPGAVVPHTDASGIDSPRA